MCRGEFEIKRKNAGADSSGSLPGRCSAAASDGVVHSLPPGAV